MAEILTLGAAALTPWWGGLTPAITLCLLIGVWLRLRGTRRERLLVAIPLGLAALVLLQVVAMSAIDGDPEAGFRAQTRRQWSGLWSNLSATADDALRQLPAELTTAEDRLEAFETLHRVAESARFPVTLLLLDPDDETIAWAGPGLLHDPEAETLPEGGRTFRAGFASASLLLIRPIERAPRRWRLVVGASHRSDDLPFPSPWWRRQAALDWSVASTPSGDSERYLSIELDATPVLRIARPTDGEFGPPHPPQRDLAWAMIGLALLAYAVSRAVPGKATGERGPAVVLAISGALGAASWGLALALDPSIAAALGVALGICVIGVLASWRTPASRFGSFAGAGLAAIVAVAIPRLLMLDRAPVDLSGFLAAPFEILAARLALFGLALGLLAALRGTTRSTLGGGWPAAGVGLLVAAAATHDLWPVALPMLVLGAAIVGCWSAEAERRQRPSTLILLAFCAALVAATGWEVGHRDRLRHRLETEVLPRMAPPDEQEIVDISAGLREFFDRATLDDLSPGSADELSSRDVAYALWRRSPLARHDVLSALVVTPAEAPPSSFSFGLPPIRDGLADWSPEQLRRMAIPGWQGALIQGESVLRTADGPWATVRYWLQLRPGFRLASSGADELALDLLRGDPTAQAPAEDQLHPARFALYDSSGRPVIVPWAETPVLFLDAGETPGGISPTPDGRAWTFGRWASDGIEVIYLDFLGAVSAVERVGNQAISVLAVLAVLMFVALLLALPRAAVRDFLSEVLRTYSIRLLIVYTSLLLIPLLLLNIVLLGQFERRLEQQNRLAGEIGLDTAQGILGDYLLQLPTGFTVDTQIDDDMMMWLSRIAGHQVNLYWSGAVYASSRYALFTAGVLPTRIPGEVYSRLSLLGYQLSSRTNVLADTAYLEMYAPLRIPGAPPQARLILSLPLLAQQEEAAAELARLRNAAMLVTSVLFALLLVAGNRLTHRFTRPIQDLVAGTERIARGARALDVKPSDAELSALSDAINDMAEKIAVGRTKLEQEKEVVDRMVRNMTSGVVSLDRDGTVLLCNPIANELLGIGTGQNLLESLRRTDRLAPVGEFVERVDRSTQSSATVGLEDEQKVEREWSLRWVPLPGERDPAALLIVTDVTDVLKGQRLHAWAEMARLIAHEVKNPLTPIRLNTEQMREVWSRDRERFESAFDNATTTILRQVETLKEIAGQFSVYSHVPDFNPRPQDLVAHLRTIRDTYAAAEGRGIEVNFEADRDQLEVQFDPKLLDRAVENLIQNALRVTPAPGTVALTLATSEREVRISVSDTGPGVRSENLNRIFDMHFTTGEGGTGLGLPIARRVVEQHEGTIEAQNAPGGGLEVVIRLPRTRQADRSSPVDDAE